MNDLQPWLVPLLVALFASQGFWSWLTTHKSKKNALESASVRLLLGIAHDRIIFLGMKYVDRKFITADEYEDFMHYLWEPYSTFGGNGLAERVVELVKKLPVRSNANTDLPIPYIEEQHVDRIPRQHHGS